MTRTAGTPRFAMSILLIVFFMAGLLRLSGKKNLYPIKKRKSSSSR
jgi:hypothetical protein